MTFRIESKVQRGALKGEVQKPWKDDQGFYIASSERFKRDYIRIADLESLANALSAGLSVRMKAAKQSAPGLIKPTSITIDGLSVSAWKRDPKGAE